MMPDSSIQMDRTGVFFTVFAADFVSPFGDLLITPTPQSGGAGQVQNRHRRPQQRQSATEIANRVAAAVPISVVIDDIHLGHQTVVRQIRIPLSDAWIVQRNKAQSWATAIKTPQISHLALAKSTLAVINDNVSAG